MSSIELAVCCSVYWKGPWWLTAWKIGRTLKIVPRSSHFAFVSLVFQSRTGKGERERERERKQNLVQSGRINSCIVYTLCESVVKRRKFSFHNFMASKMWTLSTLPMSIIQNYMHSIEKNEFQSSGNFSFRKGVKPDLFDLECWKQC